MFRSKLSRASLLPLAVAIAWIGLWAGVAQGQQVSVRMVGGPGGLPGDLGMAASPRITTRHLDRYGDLLGLNQEQAEVLRMLFEGYEAAYNRATTKRREAMREMMEAARDGEGRMTFNPERIGVIETDHRETIRKLEAEFLDDVRALLTEAQEANWPALERQRRRETVLPRGSLSGETVDLLEVVRGLDLPEEPAGDLREALDHYELDLDRALIAKERVTADGATGLRGLGRQFDPEAMQAYAGRIREVGLAVRDVNRRHARVIESLLPESVQEAFRAQVQQRSFPRVYRESRIQRMLAAAEGLSDLNDDQRRTISELRESYKREVNPINSRWAAAIAERDESDDEARIPLGGGGMIMMRMGQEDEDSPAARANRARRELDERFQTRLSSILTPEQMERLPAEPEPEARVFGAIRAATEDR